MAFMFINLATILTAAHLQGLISILISVNMELPKIQKELDMQEI
jgi:hypothetical protein